MSLVYRCVVCDDRMPPYGGEACCGGAVCERYDKKREDDDGRQP